MAHRAAGMITVIVALGVLVLGGCGPSMGPRTPSPDRNLIAEDDVQAVDPGTTALQLIQRLRPNWLRGRGPTRVRSTEVAVPVYINAQLSGAGTGILSRYAAREIREIQFLDSSTATQRFGTGHNSGAIIILLR